MLNEQQRLQRLMALCPKASSTWGDDCFYDEERQLVASVDTFVEGVHFSGDYFSPWHIGWKTAAAAISDVAAMGANLHYLLTGLALPKPLPFEEVEEVYRGINALLAQLGQGFLVGGDTVASPNALMLSHTVLGFLPPAAPFLVSQPGLRSNLQAGDVIFVTSYHGLSALGLWALQTGQTGYTAAKQAHLQPVPRLGWGQQLQALNTRLTLMDTSDGLADAVLKVAEASKVVVVLQEETLAVHEELKQAEREHGKPPLQLLLYGGEDFELLVGLPADVAERVQAQPAFSFLQAVGTAVALAPGEKPYACLHSLTGEAVALRFQNTFQHFGP